MVGKIRPRKIIMPSELGAQQTTTGLSGPVITYQLARYSHIQPPPASEELMEEVKQGMVNSEKFSSMNTQKQQAVLLELVKEGKSDAEIGDMLDMSQWQIRNLRYKLGIKKDRGGNVQLEPVAGGNDPSASLINLGALHPSESSSDRGLILRVCGTYDAREVAQRLKALASLAMVESESMKYQINVTLQELSETEQTDGENVLDDESNKEEVQDESESSARVS